MSIAVLCLPWISFMFLELLLELNCSKFLFKRATVVPPPTPVPHEDTHTNSPQPDNSLSCGQQMIIPPGGNTGLIAPWHEEAAGGVALTEGGNRTPDVSVCFKGSLSFPVITAACDNTRRLWLKTASANPTNLCWATVKVRAGDSGAEGDFHFPAVKVTLEWSDWSGFLSINVVEYPLADRKYTDGGQLIKRK